ncbi:hypothetical protein TNCV_2784551 [Trichonephila clavipes]|nr:hypothetical protein TNCV_2784551 [Trichonephila clavipes]
MTAQVSSSSLDHGSRSVAKRPRVTGQCDVNIHLPEIVQLTVFKFGKHVSLWLSRDPLRTEIVKIESQGAYGKNDSMGVADKLKLWEQSEILTLNLTYKDIENHSASVGAPYDDPSRTPTARSTPMIITSTTPGGS